MKYVLKDKNLQVKLDEISNGEFSENLNEMRAKVSPKSPDDMFNVYFGEVEEEGYVRFRFSCEFRYDEVKAVKEYNPNRWNKYPEIEPPSNVLMRCECDIDNGDHKSKRCFSAVYIDYNITGNDIGWFDDQGNKVEVHRFRPWDDN